LSVEYDVVVLGKTRVAWRRLSDARANAKALTLRHCDFRILKDIGAHVEQCSTIVPHRKLTRPQAHMFYPFKADKPKTYDVADYPTTHLTVHAGMHPQSCHAV
jgi:hypothetical protein